MQPRNTGVEGQCMHILANRHVS